MFATAVRIEHDLGVPSVSLHALTGHCSCAPEDCSGLVAIPPQGPVPVSGVFPAGAAFRLLETGLQVIRLSPYRADLPARHPVRLGMCCRLAGMLFSHLAFQPPVSHQIQRHLLSSLPAARAIQQCTSWRTDYYGHSVAIGLASRRRSHVHKCYTSERDLGVPFASFNALTGHRSCVPEDYGMLPQFRRRDRRRLQASFRRGTSYPFWRLGFRQSSFRHITRIFPARRPVRLGTAAGFLACYCPLHLSDLWVSHQIQRYLLSSLPAARAI